MEDIGVVEYSWDSDKSRILAEWHYFKEGRIASCTGIATGDSINGFEGGYIVTYYNMAGKELSKFNLSIVRDGNCFRLTWVSEGKTVYTGAGIEKNGRLYAGWRSC